jgi:hypothetical protein
VMTFRRGFVETPSSTMGLHQYTPGGGSWVTAPMVRSSSSLRDVEGSSARRRAAPVPRTGHQRPYTRQP